MNGNDQNLPSNQIPEDESEEYTQEQLDALQEAVKAIDDFQRATGQIPNEPQSEDYEESGQYVRALFEWLKSADLSNVDGVLFGIYLERQDELIRFKRDSDLHLEFLNWLEDVAAGQFKEPAGQAAKMLGMDYYDIGKAQDDPDQMNRYIFLSKGWYYKAYLFGAIVYEQFKEKYPDWEDYENTLINGYYFKLNVILGLPENHGATEFFSLHPNAQRTQAEQNKQSAGKGGGCYIATAVYGSYDAPEVLVLRRFRDESLSQSVLGRIFIKVYYRLSPTFAEWLKGTNRLNTAMRHILSRIVKQIENH